MDLICSKCNYVLDLDIDLDDGVCPKCFGMIHQEGESFEDLEQKRSIELIQDTFLKLRLINPIKKILN